MGAKSLENLRKELMALPESERAKLAHDLIQSLDEPRDTEVEEAWDREILRRIREVDAGDARLLDRAEFRQRLRANLDKD